VPQGRIYGKFLTTNSYFVPTKYLICLCTGTLEGRNNYAVGADSRR
jgi:hypothetical protein